MSPLIVPEPAVARQNQHPEELDVPALLMMDSLKIHNCSITAKTVRQWLNHEWPKKSSESGCSIFTDSTIKLIKPFGECIRKYHIGESHYLYF
jgi:hypothetical protein